MPLRVHWWLCILFLLAVFLAGPARAAVSLRVEARPVSDPIKALVTVTDANGDPVSDLKAADFTVLVDGVTVSSPTFSLPPAQDPSQRVSVVFVMDYSMSVTSAALLPLQESIIAFINAMQLGDFAAIIKFNETNPSRVSVVQPFTEIDGAAGTSALIGAVMSPYPGDGSPLYDGLKLAVELFTAPSTSLPTGPKAIVVATDGDEYGSQVTGNTAVAMANEANVPFFPIGVGTVEDGRPLEIMTELALRTGGKYLPAPGDTEIADAYVTISHMLNNEYVLSFQSAITDCGSHTIEVRVTDQTPATSAFTRCTPTTPPPPSGGGGGGGGGAYGFPEILAGLTLYALRRRRRAA